MADDEDTPTLPAVISRKDAIAKGLKRYFTGKPCKRGHVVERLTHGECPKCQKLRDAGRRDKIRAYQNEYRRRNHEKMLQQERARRAANPEIGEKASAKYYAANGEKLRERVRTHRAANREQVNARQRELRAADPERHRKYTDKYLTANKARIAEMRAERARRFKLEHPEKVAEKLARLLAWKAADPERAKACAAIRRSADPVRVRAYTAKRKALKKASGGTYTAADIADLHRLQKGKCAICKTSIRETYHIDHITPLVRGGSNARSNLQLLCPPCNQRKSDRDPIAHMQSLGMLL